MPDVLRPIVAKDQVRLGAGRGLRLALSGMSYRMFRASVTMAILALATAFLVHMLSYGLMQQGAERHAFNELLRQRQVGQMMTRLSEADPDTAIIDGLASGRESRLTEYCRWSNLGESETAAAVRIAKELRAAARALNDLPVAARAVLLGDVHPDDFLLNFMPDKVVEFETQSRQLSVRVPLGTPNAFRRFAVEGLPQLRAYTVAVKEGQHRAIAELGRLYPGQSVADIVRQPTPELARHLSNLGYALSLGDLNDLSSLERRTSDTAAVNRLLQNGEVSAELGRMASIDASRLSFETVSTYATTASRAREVQRVLRRAGDTGSITAERLLALTTERNREVKLARALGEQTEAIDTGILGLSERNQWLVALSFLVCIIGVANAMLMSVTERFTEIATMKCLGAMDGFVMMMFVFEAMIQGVVGGIVGLFIGVLLAMVRAALEYGSLLLSAPSVIGPVFLAMGVSLIIGVMLAAIAAVGPAWLAARLSPMEAMRVE